MDPSLATGLLESVATLLSDGLLVVDPDYSIVLWNGAIERTSGLLSKDLLGKHLFSVFPFLVETGEDQVLRDALEGRSASSKDRPFRFESTRRSGFFDAHYTPWRGKAGEILGCVAVIRDITESKRASLQARETELRFKSMADVAPVVLWMSGPDGFCTFFNQTWLDFTGRSMQEEWGVGWAEGVHFEDFQRCMDTYAKAFNERAIIEMEYRLRRHDGAYRWTRSRASPLSPRRNVRWLHRLLRRHHGAEAARERAAPGRARPRRLPLDRLARAPHADRGASSPPRKSCRTIEKTSDLRDELRSRLDRHAHGSREDHLSNHDGEYAPMSPSSPRVGSASTVSPSTWRPSSQHHRTSPRLGQPRRVHASRHDQARSRRSLGSRPQFSRSSRTSSQTR